MKLQRITFVIGALLIFDSAQAGPPFVTDDPEPPPPGDWEINVPFILERTPSKTEMDAPLLDFNYGLPNVQLKLEIPVKVVNTAAEGTMAGVGDLLVGVKWRFLKRGFEFQVAEANSESDQPLNSAKRIVSSR